MKKILFVIGTMTNGGAERVISVLVTWFAKQSYYKKEKCGKI